MNIKQTLGFISLTLFIYASQAESLPSARLIDRVIGAKPIKRVAPKYPTIAAKKGQEGWVQLSFVIDKEGKVIEPIIEDSSGIRNFERAALSAITQWKYSPAKQDGQNIEQCKTTVQMDFKLRSDKQGVTRRFHSRYKKIASAIQAKNFTEAATLLDKLETDKLWNFTENDWYWLIKSQYGNAIGDKKLELSAIIRAIKGKENTIGIDNYLVILQRKFFLELEFGNYAYALGTIKKIKKAETSEDIKKQFSEYEIKLENLIQSNEMMAREVTISDRGHVNHLLSRNRFQLSKIDGSLKEIEIRCDNKRSRFTASDSSIWTIPKNWGQCTVFIKGQENTQFSILELANQA